MTPWDLINADAVLDNPEERHALVFENAANKEIVGIMSYVANGSPKVA
jgi:hypothetical protein